VPSAEFWPDMILKSASRCFRCSALVDDRLQLAIALMQCPGEMDGSREDEPIEFGLSKCPLVIRMPTVPLQ